MRPRSAAPRTTRSRPAVTGDNPRAAAWLAEEVGTTGVRAGLLPQDKVAAVSELEWTGRKVLVGGDGLNGLRLLADATWIRTRGGNSR